jgi:SNF2 family DNA or RNA helicase
MGTGKSMTAIGLMEHNDARLVLIACPKSVLTVWPREFQKHAREDWEVFVPPSKATVQKRAAAVVQAIDRAAVLKRRLAVLVNYDAVWRTEMHGALMREWDYVVCDESHRIKKPDGRASKTMHMIGVLAKRKLCLTGTPMPHSPADVFAQYRFLDPGIFGTKLTTFRNQFCVMGGYQGKNVVGYQNQDELQRRVGRIAYFCKASEVLDLPEYQHVTRTFEMDTKALKAYQTLEQDFILGVKDGTVTPKNALVKLLRLRQTTSGVLRDDDGTDHVISEERKNTLADVLDDLAVDEPVVVFCAFKHDLANVRAVAEQQGRRYGEISGSVGTGHAEYGIYDHTEPDESLRGTMRRDLDIVGVQIQSGGVGIDLTRAAYAVYYSIDFSLGNFDQSLARVHRPGQTRSTTYVHIVAERPAAPGADATTIDGNVYSALMNRRNVVETLIEQARAY